MADDLLAGMIGELVVFDTQGPLIYIGHLEQVTEQYFVLTGADVHDTNDSRATKDLYLVETRDLGIRANRGKVVVMRGQISSVSLLKEIVD